MLMGVGRKGIKQLANRSKFARWMDGWMDQRTNGCVGGWVDELSTKRKKEIRKKCDEEEKE